MSVRSRTGVLGKGTPRVPPPTGAIIPEGTCQGQILFWDVATQSYVLTACPDDGDVFIYDAASGLVVPREPLLNGIMGFGANQVAAGTTYLFSWYGVAASVASGTQAPLTLPGPAGATIRVRRMRMRQGTPAGATGVTYTVRINGANTALDIATNSGVSTASDLVTEVTGIAGQEITIEAVNAGALFTPRVEIIVEWDELI
jgi:hypothetical protein